MSRRHLLQLPVPEWFLDALEDARRTSGERHIAPICRRAWNVPGPDAPDPGEQERSRIIVELFRSAGL